MANVVEVVNDVTGETQHLDVTQNFFDKSLYGVTHDISDENMNALRRETRWLLQKFGYNTESLQDVLNVWHRNNGWMMNLMSNHPSWHEDKFMISYETEVERHISKSGINKFRNWAISETQKLSYWDKFLAEIDYLSYCTMCDLRTQYSNVYDTMSNCEDNVWSYRHCLPQEKENEDDTVELILNGKDKNYYWEMKDKMDKTISQYDERNDKIYVKGTNNKIDAAIAVFNVLSSVDKQFIDESLADRFNNYLRYGNFETEAKKGQKVSKLIAKFCIEIGLDKVKDEQDVSFTDQNGEVHNKVKDMGYNYYFYSVFADAINPTKKKMIVCFSLNPIDWLTMSFGNSWASCHTIDVDQLRKEQGDGTHNYHGMYSSGTMSYMLDSSSIIMYYVNPESKDELENGIAHPELRDKFKRCVFCIGENKIIQSRVYPDGRNKDEGTDEDGIATQLATDMRTQFEEMISRCMNVPNNWVYKAGTGTASEMTDSRGTHYRDYLNYSDCGTVYLKIGERLVKNTNEIKIGHDPICPCCGKEHHYQENIQCEDCISRSPNGKQVSRILAYNLDGNMFHTYEDRKNYVQNYYPASEWDNLWDRCATEDAARLKRLNEDDAPTTPFVEAKNETENENVEAETDSAVA